MHNDHADQPHRSDADTAYAPSDAAEIAGPAPAPISSAERIDAIDVLRGFALLGIFVMNIPTFALSATSFFNPTRHGGFDGADYAAWLGSHLVFEMKMMTIFSLLFGSGIYIFTSRAEARSGRSAGLFYKRMFWLLIIGLLHAYVVWEGDILFTYAVCGMLVYPLRRLRPRTQFILGAALVLMVVAINTGTGYFFHSAREAHRQVAAAGLGATLAETEGGPSSLAPADSVEDPEARPLDGAQASDGAAIDEDTRSLAEAWEEIRADFEPTEQDLVKEREQVLGGYFDSFGRRAEMAFWMQTQLLLIFGVWRIGGLMLIGMALLRWGVVTAERSTGFYAAMAAVGYGAGLPAVYIGAQQLQAHDFDIVYTFKAGWHYNTLGSLAVAGGHIGLLMLVCRLGVLRVLRAALAAVGRMALTNYLMQSLIAATVFYGWGLGYWGELSRAELLLVVLAVWAFQLAVSPLWLRRFRFGPAEWVWRSLTYGRSQPMRAARA